MSALEQLMDTGAPRDLASLLNAFLVAARLEAQGLDPTTSNVNEVTSEVLGVLDESHGRIDPFREYGPDRTWLVAEDSGRKTVWNHATRGNQGTVLFNDTGVRPERDIRNGLREDASAVLRDRTEGHRPPDEALAVFLLRNHEFESEPTRTELLDAACEYLGISPEDFEEWTAQVALGVPITQTDDGPWRAEAIKDRFPPPWEGTVEPAVAHPAAPVGISLDQLPTAFNDFLESLGLVLTDIEQLDLLASIMSAQFLLMAGPSGTGKSSVAKALARFFCPEDRRARVDARKHLTRPEEFLGQHSYLADGRFLSTDALLGLLTLHGVEGVVPICVVEEINLSPVEGYLNPLVLGLGETRVPELRIRLHGGAEPVPDEQDTDVPPALELAPFPRFLGSLNVDQDARAPARKVIGRSCVVLLEPPPIDRVMEAAEAVQATTTPLEAAGAGLLGDPHAALDRYRASGNTSLRSALHTRLKLVNEAVGADVVTPRDANRCLAYMAQLKELAGETVGGMDTADLGAELALLHFVLPMLTPDQFVKVVPRLAKEALDGGLLQRRIGRLDRLSGDTFGTLVDFWQALS